MSLTQTHKQSAVLATDKSAKPVLLFVDDRPNTLGQRVFERDDYELILLRHSDHALSPEYLEKTRSFKAFYRDRSASKEAQIQEFRDWCLKNAVTPGFMLNPSEPEQQFAHALGRAIGVPSLTDQQVDWLRNKVSMKDKFREIGFKTAEYAAVKTPEDLVAFGQQHGWPIVLKAQDGFACIDTYLIRNAEEALQKSLKPESLWMAETFMGGIEWECCALVSDGKVLDTYVSFMPARPLEIVDGAINANITVRPGPQNLTADTRQIVQQLVDGMNLDHGYMHLEFFMTPENELFMGEAAMRMAGCEVPANHGYACNFNLFDALIDIHLGRKPDMTYGPQRCVGDLLLPVKKGKITAMTSPQELLCMPGVIAHKPRVTLGQVIDPRRASHTCSAIVHVEGDTLEQVLSRMEYVLTHYKIEAQPVIEPSTQPKP